jgi:formylglycine-generating enzyme required for sulfatase activity
MVKRQMRHWLKRLALPLALVLIGGACSSKAEVPASTLTATPQPPPTSLPSPTMTATPAATAVPEPVLAEGVLFYDDFTDPLSGWNEAEQDDGRFGYHPPDFYHVEVSTSHDSATVFAGLELEDFTAETEVLVDHTDTENGAFRYGLAVRQTGEDYYAFSISPRQGSWQVLKSSPAGLETLAEGSIGTLTGLTTVDKLRVDASGPNFIYSINDQVFAQVNDPDYASGDVGFFVENLDETLAHIHYDSFTIQEVEIDAMAIAPTPTPVPTDLPTASGMADIPGGSYNIGYDAAGDSYVSQHAVELQEFWIDLYEVTNARYAVFLAETGNPPPASWPEGSLPAGQENHPVQGVTWELATAYCQWAKKRLPSEAEWEVVARGAVGWLYPWGNDQHLVELPHTGTYPVGSVSDNRSPFGAFDMAGNVWEWVGETYAPVTDGNRVLRGGANDFLKDMAYRLQGDPSVPTMFATAGMRCAADRVLADTPDQAAARVRDDFSDPDSGWPALELDTGRYGYHPPDFYHVEASALNDRITVFQGPSFSDMTVETEVLVDHTDTESGAFRYGLAVRQAGDEYYAFTISPRQGSWQVLKSSSTGLETLAEGSVDGLQGMSGLDGLQVDASGPNFIFSINGQAVTQVNDPDYASGNVGFYVETLDETLAHIHYDSLTIRDVEVSVRAEEAEIQDDFTDPGSGWPILELDAGRAGYHPPDFYHVEVDVPDDNATVFAGLELGDFTAETEVLVDHTDTENGAFRYGLAVRQTGEGYYAFTISPRQGSWQVLKRSPAGLETLAEGSIGTLRGLITTDKLRVDASGPNFVYSIDGEAVTEVNDPEYASGDVGFYVETLDETLAHIHYDSLTIREAQASEPASQGPWQAAYFSNGTLSGEPALVRQDAAIDFDWKLGAPTPALPADHFSVRWEATLDFQSGHYLFTTNTDDGIRLLVDGETVIESWRPMQGSRSGLVDLEGGPHTMVMEYFEDAGAAMARLSWSRTGSGNAP